MACLVIGLGHSHEGVATDLTSAREEGRAGLKLSADLGICRSLEGTLPLDLSLLLEGLKLALEDFLLLLDLVLDAAKRCSTSALHSSPSKLVQVPTTALEGANDVLLGQATLKLLKLADTGSLGLHSSPLSSQLLPLTLETGHHLPFLLRQPV